MIRFAFPTEIDRPVEDVFAFVTDPRRLPEWQTTTVSVVQEPDGPMREGTRLRELHRAPLGRDLESLVEVARYEPDRRFDLRMLEGPLLLDGNFGFERAGGGTRIDFAAEGRPRGLMRLAQPLLARSLERQFRRYFARLKELLESETPR